VPDRDLAAIGRRRARARANLDRVTEEAKEAAREAFAEGVSESELARLLQVDRMTIRTWLGKKR
jgi:DNA invertase Pin-like site-specific DNA recombinase